MLIIWLIISIVLDLNSKRPHVCCEHSFNKDLISIVIKGRVQSLRAFMVYRRYPSVVSLHVSTYCVQFAFQSTLVSQRHCCPAVSSIRHYTYIVHVKLKGFTAR